MYDVYGGYEDWAYGASFDKNKPDHCVVNEKRVKTEYNNITNRAFTFLVEAGPKLPRANTGGNEKDVFYTSQ